MKQLFFIIAIVVPSNAMADWEAPANPEPSAILSEARADARVGRYEDALAKHLWFHNHALEHRPSLYGVRLSALRTWYELGKEYPPAMKKLIEVRDDAARQMFEDSEDKNDIQQIFHEMSSINEQLSQEDQTVAIFVRLNNEFPERARKVYDVAQPALIKAKKVALCGKYLEPETAYADMVELYQLDLKFTEEQESPEDKRLQRDIAEHWFMKRAATLIALLVLNDRKPEAEKIVESVRSKSKYPKRDKIINAALEGQLPKLRFK